MLRYLAHVVGEGVFVMAPSPMMEITNLSAVPALLAASRKAVKPMMAHTTCGVKRLPPKGGTLGHGRNYRGHRHLTRFNALAYEAMQEFSRFFIFGAGTVQGRPCWVASSNTFSTVFWVIVLDLLF
jgi:hypothetical protein